jgi:hypothetical protein
MPDVRGGRLWNYQVAVPVAGEWAVLEVVISNQLGAAICVAVASTVAAAGLTRTPSIDGFTDAFTVFTVVAAVATVVSLRLVPSGTPQMTGAPPAH